MLLEIHRNTNSSGSTGKKLFTSTKKKRGMLTETNARPDIRRIRQRIWWYFSTLNLRTTVGPPLSYAWYWACQPWANGGATADYLSSHGGLLGEVPRADRGSSVVALRYFHDGSGKLSHEKNGRFLGIFQSENVFIVACLSHLIHHYQGAEGLRYGFIYQKEFYGSSMIGRDVFCCKRYQLPYITQRCSSHFCYDIPQTKTLGGVMAYVISRKRAEKPFFQSRIHIW